MHTEIADSDEDSEFPSPATPSRKECNPNITTTTVEVETGFDVHNSLIKSPLSRAAKVVKSPSSISGKRRHTVIADSKGGVSPKASLSPEQPKKRPRTYGSNKSTPTATHLHAFSGPCDGRATHNFFEIVTPNASEQSPGLFSYAPEQEPEETHMVEDPSRMCDTVSGLAALRSHEMQVITFERKRNKPRRVISLLKDSMSDGRHELITTRSSMGNYESINMDFRNTSYALDADLNPFGIASQVSLISEVGQANALELTSTPGVAFEKLAPKDSTSVDRLLLTNQIDRLHAIGPEIDASAPRLEHREMQNYDPGTLMLPYIDAADGSRSHIASGEGRVHCHTSNLAKQRGRKSKNSHLPTLSPAPDAVQEADCDSGDVVGLSVKQGDFEGTQLRVCTGGNFVLTDTNIADTRRTQHIPPSKEPTSELNLSDEAFIGLPKENYVPRPSRSRSNKAGEADTLPPDLTKVPLTPANAKSPAALQDCAIPKPLESKKMAKKSKVKRAKTSAAVLLKKSELMLSEGEEDVVWVENQPAKVNIQLPKELRPIKVQQTESRRGTPRDVEVARNDLNLKGTQALTSSPVCLKAGETNHDADRSSSEVRSDFRDEPDRVSVTSKAPGFTVEIPGPLCPNVQEETRKRGRRKKSTEVLDEQNDQATGTCPGPEDASANADHFGTPNARHPLAERDTNLNVPVGSTPNAKIFNLKDQHLTPSPQQQHTPRLTRGHSMEAPTATSPEPTMTKSNEIKRCQQHSPINPSGGKVIYRIGLSRKADIPPLLRVVRK